MNTERKNLEPVRVCTDPDDEATYKYGSCRIHVRREEDPESPRTWDNSWKWYTNHRRYGFDSEDGKTLKVDDIYDDNDRLDGESMHDAILRQHPEFLDVQPIYLYDHSGIAISLKSFSDPWDSGVGAIAVITKEQARKDFKDAPDEDTLKERAYVWLEGEVEAYDRYLQGEVYGYVVEGPSGDEIDSCWGYYEEPEEVAKEATGVISKDDLYECLSEGELINRLSEYFKSCGKRFDKYAFVKEHSNEKGWQTTMLSLGTSDESEEWFFSADQTADKLGYSKGEFHGQTLKAWPK